MSRAELARRIRSRELTVAPGVYDMKGGVFLALTAIRTLIEAGAQTPLPVRFLVVSDEEIGSPTSRAFHVR